MWTVHETLQIREVVLSAYLQTVSKTHDMRNEFAETFLLVLGGAR
ncbi:hypothetical protein KSD_78800 [Ktedonobacter sp. SOSP1-85]|nr:hypothetical protein [Ktedonobacter sp. SOSP1-85]GHO80109.1 hypothetical protein KSD_78800 [Ktedonobacter sp. SOSP1-85]